ncbi:LysR family transcriptional regulator [Verminephrobacter aporrectodeae]|uniref:LysR family transcriptional regulator n=1 Tax=Verminephrobacter aporrectodeae TaxID=1110389 RepID=UPI0022439B25|nr:LysR family transcriptional regulator [Verminephrobacter aporrectodeae]
MIALLDKFANQLDWNLLRTFMVIVQERSITLAAHRLSVTQPSVSAALRRLEERLERRLIERGGATAFQPTAAGEVLYRHCAEIYGVITALPNALDAAHAVVQGIVTLHLSGHVHWQELPGLIAAYRQQFPLVRFRVRRGICADILGQLAQKNATLGVVSAHDVRPVFTRRKLFDQEMGHYAGAAAPDERVASLDICNAPVIGYEGEQTGTPLAALSMHRIRAGLEGATVAEAPDCEALAALVRAGAGIGALPRRYARECARLTELPLDPVVLPVYLVRHEQVTLSPAEQSFLQYLDGSADRR